MTREIRDKDLQPPGPRKAMFYLGNKMKFEERFKRWIKLKRDKLEEERRQKKLMAGIEEAEDVDIDNENEFVNEEEFLKQFPGLNGHFKTNTEL